MAGEQTDPLMRQFQEIIAGADLDELREVAAELLALGRSDVLDRPRPDLRRPALDEVRTFRLRVDLARSTPRIWRRLDIRSDTTLDVVHKVLQAAFDWSDSHLHRFSLGGGPFDAGSELFLCPYDAEHGETEGAPAHEVRLDEVVQDPGDVLQYAYDYGDGWELTLRLEAWRPHDGGRRVATCVDGGRAAPPEDCGGITTAAELAEVIPDPAAFDVAEVNRSLQDPFLILREHGVHPQLVEMLNRLQYSDEAGDLLIRALSLTDPVPAPPPEEIAGALRAHLWFLDLAAEGIRLTPAGYLKPVDVAQAAAVVPEMADWIGPANREADAFPVLLFRQSLQRLGLIRKVKDRLVLTKAGAAVRGNPERLFAHLAARLVPKRSGDFEGEATVLILFFAATFRLVSPAKVADTLTQLRWRVAGERRIEGHDLYRLTADPLRVLRNVGSPAAEHSGKTGLNPVAVALARSALRSEG